MPSRVYTRYPDVHVNLARLDYITAQLRKVLVYIETFFICAMSCKIRVEGQFSFPMVDMVLKLFTLVVAIVSIYVY